MWPIVLFLLMSVIMLFPFDEYDAMKQSREYELMKREAIVSIILIKIEIDKFLHGGK